MSVGQMKSFNIADKIEEESRNTSSVKDNVIHSPLLTQPGHAYSLTAYYGLKVSPLKDIYNNCKIQDNTLHSLPHVLIQITQRIWEEWGCFINFDSNPMYKTNALLHRKWWTC